MSKTRRLSILLRVWVAVRKDTAEQGRWSCDIDRLLLYVSHFRKNEMDRLACVLPDEGYLRKQVWQMAHFSVVSVPRFVLSTFLCQFSTKCSSLLLSCVLSSLWEYGSSTSRGCLVMYVWLMERFGYFCLEMPILATLWIFRNVSIFFNILLCDSLSRKWNCPKN
jgi:hypothetical protein